MWHIPTSFTRCMTSWLCLLLKFTIYSFIRLIKIKGIKATKDQPKWNCQNVQRTFYRYSFILLLMTFIPFETYRTKMNKTLIRVIIWNVFDFCRIQWTINSDIFDKNENTLKRFLKTKVICNKLQQFSWSFYIKSSDKLLIYWNF